MVPLEQSDQIIAARSAAAVSLRTEQRLAQLARFDLLVIDDFAISPMGAAERNDLLELLDDRIGA